MPHILPVGPLVQPQVHLRTANMHPPRTVPSTPPPAAWISWHSHEDTRLWMLKYNKQRGTGLVRTADAFAACFETTKRPPRPGGRDAVQVGGGSTLCMSC